MKKFLYLVVLFLVFFVGCGKKDDSSKLVEIFKQKVPENILYSNKNVKYKFYVDGNNEISYDFYNENNVVVTKANKLTKTKEDGKGEVFLVGSPVNPENIIERDFYRSGILKLVTYINAKNQVEHKQFSEDGKLTVERIYSDRYAAIIKTKDWAKISTIRVPFEEKSASVYDYEGKTYDDKGKVASEHFFFNTKSPSSTSIKVLNDKFVVNNLIEKIYNQEGKVKTETYFCPANYQAQKTVAQKNFYDSGDIKQILICGGEVDYDSIEYSYHSAGKVASIISVGMKDGNRFEKVEKYFEDGKISYEKDMTYVKNTRVALKNVETSYYSNGKVDTSIKYENVDSQENGLVKQFYDSGKLYTEYQFVYVWGNGELKIVKKGYYKEYDDKGVSVKDTIIGEESSEPSDSEGEEYEGE